MVEIPIKCPKPPKQLPTPAGAVPLNKDNAVGSRKAYVLEGNGALMAFGGKWLVRCFVSLQYRWHASERGKIEWGVTHKGDDRVDRGWRCSTTNRVRPILSSREGVWQKPNG